MLKKISTILCLSILFLSYGCSFWGGQPDVENIKEAQTEEEKETLKEKAQELYEQKKKSGVSLIDGPCLGSINDSWVVDIAHSPRLPIDNRPNNQCEKYRSGEATHFIELDTEGNFIRMK